MLQALAPMGQHRLQRPRTYNQKDDVPFGSATIVLKHVLVGRTLQEFLAHALRDSLATLRVFWEHKRLRKFGAV